MYDCINFRFQKMEFSNIFGPNPLCRERQFTSDPGNLDLPAPRIFLDDTSVSDAHFAVPGTSRNHAFDTEVSLLTFYTTLKLGDFVQF